VDVRHVAVAARSERHATVPGREPPPSFAPLSRFWKTRDGHVRTHANYPWHRERALAVLGCPPDVDSVAAALGERTTLEVEDSFAEAGALAFGVRTVQEWAAHPHGRAVSSLPLVERDTSSTRSRAFGPGQVLEGVKVLDLTRVIAGPVAARTLAAWGADVLRLDSPRLPENTDQCTDTLTGKRSALLDAADPHDRRVLEDLLAQADVVVQGYRPGAFARLGLDADALAERHPHLSVVTLSAWGTRGPWAQRRGFDSLVQAPTGLASLEGGADGPGALPAQVLDHATGYLAAAASAFAVAGSTPARAQLSLAQTSAWLLSVQPSEARRVPEADLDVKPWLTHVPGPGRGVNVVAPPGRIGARTPTWRSTAAYGRDPAAFRSAP
jgi:hypothetical protein